MPAMKQDTARFKAWLDNTPYSRVFGIKDVQNELGAGYMQVAGWLNRAKAHGLITHGGKNKYKRTPITKEVLKPYKRDEKIVSLGAVPEKAKQLWAPKEVTEDHIAYETPRPDPLPKAFDDAVYFGKAIQKEVNRRPAQIGWQCPGCLGYINPTHGFCPRCAL